MFAIAKAMISLQPAVEGSGQGDFGIRHRRDREHAEYRHPGVPVREDSLPKIPPFDPQTGFGTEDVSSGPAEEAAGYSRGRRELRTGRGTAR